MSSQIGKHKKGHKKEIEKENGMKVFYIVAGVLVILAIIIGIIIS